MKKAYVTPAVEKVDFQYDKAVVASGQYCTNEWKFQGDNGCKDQQYVKNLLD